MSSPWASPNPNDPDQAQGSQQGFTAPGPQPGFTAPGPQPGFSAPGPQPGFSAPGPQPGFSAPGSQAESVPRASMPASAAPTASGYSRSSTWGWAPKPGIIPLRPLGIADLISGSFAALRANPKLLVGFTLLVMTIVGLVNAIVAALPFYALMSSLDSASDPQASTQGMLQSASLSLMSILLGYITLFVCALVSGALLNGVLASAVSQMVIGKKLTFGQAWALTRPRLGALIGTALITLLIVGIPIVVWLGCFVGVAYMSADSRTFGPLSGLFILALFPLILGLFALNVRFIYAPICAVLEEKRPVEAFKRSWALTSGSFWPTVGKLMLIGLLCSMIINIISLLIGTIVSVIAFAFLSSSAVSSADGTATILVFLAITVGLQTIVYSLVVPIMCAYQTLMYVDEKIRRENFAVVLARASEA